MTSTDRTPLEIVEAEADTKRADRLERSRLAESVMRKQGTLSVRVALIFLLLLFGLPLVNQYLPAIANLSIGGFTLTWLFLGVLFYPLTWLLSGYFIRASDRIEAESVQDYRRVHTESESVLEETR